MGKITTFGSIVEYSLGSARGPRDIVSGPDGNLWFTEESARKVAKITTSGTVTVTTPGPTVT